EIPKMQVTLTGIKVCPRPPLTCLKFGCDFKLSNAVLESLLVFALVHCILTQKLQANCLSEQNVVSFSEIQRALCPSVGIVVETTMLICAGEVRVCLRNQGSS